ncbi:hypothetical protein TNCV_4224661 [Trichonephila clavipes]|nr:hypothetical protein TNCV_4224661 [Trichonephila clavipes]
MLNRHLNVLGQYLTVIESIFGWVVLASKTALKYFYVDDLMSGANSLSGALEPGKRIDSDVVQCLTCSEKIGF